MRSATSTCGWRLVPGWLVKHQSLLLVACTGVGEGTGVTAPCTTVPLCACRHANVFNRYFRGHTGRVTTLSMSPKSDLFLSAAEDKQVGGCPFQNLWGGRPPWGGSPCPLGAGGAVVQRLVLGVACCMGRGASQFADCSRCESAGVP